MKAKLVSLDGLSKIIELPKPLPRISVQIYRPLSFKMYDVTRPMAVDIQTREYELYITVDGLEYRECWKDQLH